MAFGIEQTVKLLREILAQLKVGGGGGGGGASTIADGADVTQGSKADVLATGSVGSFSIVALLKWIGSLLNARPALPFGANYMAQSNIDANGNYQTVIYKSGGSGGTVVKTITMTFDANSNVLTYLES